MIILVLRYILTQRSSCNGRLLVEKRVSLFIQAQNAAYFVVHEMIF